MSTQHSEHPNGLTGINASQIEQVLRQPFLDDWIAGIVVDEQAEGPSQRFYTFEPLPSVSVENYTSKIASDAEREVARAVKEGHRRSIKTALVFGRGNTVQCGDDRITYISGFVEQAGRLPTAADKVKITAIRHDTEPEYFIGDCGETLFLSSRIVRLEIAAARRAME